MQEDFVTFVSKIFTFAWSLANIVLMLPSAARSAQKKLLVVRKLFLKRFIFNFAGSYHQYECGYKDMFGSILDNVYKDKKSKTGSTKDMVRLCYRVKYFI